MATKAGGGSTAARKRAKDGEMARRLKEDGERRAVGRCPICNGIVGLSDLYVHVAYHKA